MQLHVWVVAIKNLDFTIYSLFLRLAGAMEHRFYFALIQAPCDTAIQVKLFLRQVRYIFTLLICDVEDLLIERLLTAVLFLLHFLGELFLVLGDVEIAVFGLLGDLIFHRVQLVIVWVLSLGLQCWRHLLGNIELKPASHG